jgi:hypothetical protein
MGEKEISIDFTELHRIEAYCPNCKTGILLDMADDRVPSGLCPGCHKELPPHITTAIKAYLRFSRTPRPATQW